jgi:hypothetical protein
MPAGPPKIACSIAPATSRSQMKTNGLAEPRIATSRGRSNSAVIWLRVVSPRMVPTRNTTCSSAGCARRYSASISSTRRLWWMCHTPHHAATSAMPPRPSKNPKMRTSANAEFWMPTSIEIARRSYSGMPVAAAMA